MHLCIALVCHRYARCINVSVDVIKCICIIFRFQYQNNMNLAVKNRTVLLMSTGYDFFNRHTVGLEFSLGIGS